MWQLYVVVVIIAMIGLCIMKKIHPESVGAYFVYVLVILLLLALVFQIENAW